MGSGFGTNIQNSVNGVGLSSLSLTAAHAGTSPTNSWVSASTLTGAVTFDLGGIFTVDSFSFWNQNGGGPGANGSTGIGVTSDRPVQGDFTGDGKADIAFWRPADGNWFVVRSEDSSFFAFPFGSNGDVPVPGDYDGDGRQDAAVFRPTSATWFLNRSTAGIAIQQFGLPTDTPIPSAFVP